MKTLIIPEGISGRLDKNLASLIEATRSQIEKAAGAGKIFINGEPANKKSEIIAGDKVEFDENFFIVKDRDKTPTRLEIIFEDEDVIVINKPANILVHHAPGNMESTIVDSLVDYYPAIKNVGDDEMRPGIVHRLDKHASGVLIVAKNNAAFKYLKDQFKNRQTKKRYTVLVEGYLDQPNGTINLSIERSKAHGRMAAKPPEQGGREAITHYDLIEQFPHHALLDVVIETGRTHQIRVHMFAQGHPVVGDTLYRMKNTAVRDIGRLFLHATELSITLPSGEYRTFTASLPVELEDVLKDIPKI
jgi:23S rRNA pseudouridine1911/1915/1917 synthase